MASTDGHTARYDRCCEEEERICKLAGSQERFETYRICKLAGSQERFETHGRTRARVECGFALHLPLHLPLHQPPNRSVRSCHSSRLVIRVPPVGPWRDRTDGQVLCSVQIKSLDKKLRKLDAAMTHAKDDPSLLAPMASKANAGVAADGRELNRGSAEAAAGMGSSNGGVGSNAQPEGGGAWANLTLAEKLRARCAGNTPPAAGAAVQCSRLSKVSAAGSTWWAKSCG